MRFYSLIFAFIFAASVSAQSPEVLQPFNEGTKLAGAADFKNALVSFKKAFTAAKSDNVNFNFLAKLHYNLGVCEFKTNNPNAAIDEFEQALTFGLGNYTKASYALGMVHLAAQHWTAAEDAFLQAVRLDGKNGEAWFDLGFAYLGQADLEHAEAAFRTAIALKSVDAAWGHNNIGVIRAMHGDLSAAEKEFETALKMSDGQMPEARKNLEFCRTKMSGSGLLAKYSLHLLGGERNGF